MNRVGFIGGSDIGALMGLSKYKTPFQLYLEKINEAPELSKDKQDFFNRRKLAEDYIVNVFTSETGISVFRKNFIHVDNEYDFFRSEIDFEMYGEDGNIINGEAKSISVWNDDEEWGESFTDFVPKEYLLQVQWGLMCSGANFCKLIAMKGFDDFRQYYIYRNDELIAQIREEALKFWQCIFDRVPPAPKTVEDFELKGCNNRPVEADDKIFDLIERKKFLDGSVKELEQVKDEIKLYIGENETLMLHGEVLATWKEQSTERGDFKSFEACHPELARHFKKTTKSRVLRVK